MRTDILTITLNPTVDYATSADEVYPDHKLRCSEPHIDPGGGGINVARAVRQLGGQATALIAIGGGSGAQMLQLLALEGVPTVAFQGPGETRLSFSVTDLKANEQYRFVMPGPIWTEKDVERGLTSIDQSTGDGTMVVLSGSQPPGVAKEFPSILAHHVTGRQARLIVDTSGPALFDLVRQTHEAVYVLRMDDAEAEELAGKPLPDRADTAAFARGLVEKGAASNVIVARGADGSVMANREGAWHAVAPRVEVVSKVGAGDSFVGGFALSAARGEGLPDCLKFGVAAAAAACTTAGTQLCDLGVAEGLLEKTVLEEI
ncbi:1-phosphofructokinase family hexose kinase [Psychromarinibacter sp. C21-152]|uniref:Phosphofructokinase n=1 Tax=Psychromarinibacter sediminicola TaxID=3033385 RepID=A0AAE3NZJ3_9RHOB|nr:1-phosphofructokinase family hexose kinase [Psychromarinibacter sediminicola]MDF0603810.1 1-phosphofructokinase family hexose kinase [Psychromarinibacter sediminicola]